MAGTGNVRTTAQTEPVDPLGARAWAAVVHGARTSREVAEAMGCSVERAQLGIERALDAGIIGCGYDEHSGIRQPRTLHNRLGVSAHG